MKFRMSVLGAIVLSCLLTAATALAQDPTGSTYSGVGNDIAQQTGVAGDTATVQGLLPFTGLDLAMAVAAGLLLVALGLMIRRRSRPTA